MSKGVQVSGYSNVPYFKTNINLTAGNVGVSPVVGTYSDYLLYKKAAAVANLVLPSTKGSNTLYPTSTSRGILNPRRIPAGVYYDSQTAFVTKLTAYGGLIQSQNV